MRTDELEEYLKSDLNNKFKDVVVIGDDMTDETKVVYSPSIKAIIIMPKDEDSGEGEPEFSNIPALLEYLDEVL